MTHLRGTTALACALSLLAGACGGSSAPTPPASAPDAASAAPAGAATAARRPADAASGASATNASPAREIELSETAQREAGLVIESLESTRRPHVVAATGQLVPSEEATWRVGALVDGRVTAVLVSVGDRVTRGQVLARVHSHEVHEARAAYRVAKGELERRRMLADQAQRVHDRTHRLFDLKAASREQMEMADTELRSAAIGIEHARTELEKARTHITEFLDLSTDDLDRPGDAAVSHSDAAEDGDTVPIKAPAAGTVMERFATPGTVVAPGAQMFTVASLSSLWMAAAVNEADLSRLRVGQSAVVSVKAYPGEPFAGRVIKLGDALDPATRTLQVRIALPNPHGRLKPEMFATAAIEGANAASRGGAGSPRNSGSGHGDNASGGTTNGRTANGGNARRNANANANDSGGHSTGTNARADREDAERTALFIPQAAVQDVRGEAIVFVRVSPTRFAVRTVTLGAAEAGAREALTGLQAGDQIVTRGAFTLKTELLKSTLESD